MLGFSSSSSFARLSKEPKDIISLSLSGADADADIDEALDELEFYSSSFSY